MKLTEKYARLLDSQQLKFCDHEKVAEITDITKTTIDDKYIAYPTQHKTGGLFVIIKLYMSNKNNFDVLKIEGLLEDFYKYIDEGYDKYMDSLVLMNDKTDATLTYYYGFINKKK